jgi:MFS family permease
MSTAYADIANTAAGSGRPPFRALLRSRSYLLLWTAQLTSLLAEFFNYVAVAWLVLQLTGSTLAVGSILAAAAVPRAVLMLLGGALSDRLTPRTTMLAAGLARGVVMGVLAALVLTGSVQLWQLFVGAVLLGVISAFFMPASTSILPRLVADDQLEAGNALLNLSRTAAMVLGPVAGGVIVAVAGAGYAFTADAAGFFLVALLVAGLPAGGRGPGASAKSALGDVRDGVVHVWRDIPLRVTLVVIAILNLLALGAIEVGLPALAHQRFTQGAIALGSAFAAWGIGSTLGSLAAGARPAPRRFGWLLVGTVALLGAGIAGAGVAPTLPVLVAVMAITGVVEGLATTYVISWIQRRTERDMQGRVMSLVMLTSVGLEPLALAVAGALAAQNLALLFWISAAAVELTALAAGVSRTVRRL